MKVVAAADVRHLPRFSPNHRAPLWWGVAGLILVESSVAASFIVSYFYLAKAQPWPPPGFEPPPLLWPTVNLVLLLTSCGTMYWAGQSINRGNQRHLTLGVSLSVLLASVVLVLRGLEFAAYEVSWNSHAYGAIVWTIAGFHFTHVASIVVGSAVVALLAWRGYFTRERQLGVVVDTLYWYFVCLAWVPLYLTLYWAPRLYMAAAP